MKTYKFRINGNEYNVDINSVEGNIADVSVNGTSYQVEMENEIQAPADGTVTAILVNKGDSVLEGAEIVKIA